MIFINSYPGSFDALFKPTDKLTLVPTLTIQRAHATAIRGSATTMAASSAGGNPFVIGEVQYRYGDNKVANGFSGLLKVGGFADLGKLDDKRFGTHGLSLADPASNEIARRYHQNHGFMP